MKILDHIIDQTISLTLAAGEEQHLVLIDPVSCRLEVTQQRDSRLTLHLIHLSDDDCNAEIIVDQTERGAETRLYGLGLLKGEQKVSVTTRVRHLYANPQAEQPGGYSDQLFKFVAADKARAEFYGELKVMPDAQKTEAHQTNRNILLSDTAKILTRPQLEIYADDVKCSHGATTGQLDRSAIFYMQQRGISEASARRLMLSAFLCEVLTGLPDELRETQQQRIDERL